MPIFKAPNNDTFRRDREDQIDGLPEGCVLITEEEFEQILASRTIQPTLADQKEAQAQKLLDDNKYFSLPRLIESVEVSKTVAALGGVNEATFYASNPMYKKVRDLRDEVQTLLAEAAALRGQQ